MNEEEFKVPAGPPIEAERVRVHASDPPTGFPPLPVPSNKSRSTLPHAESPARTMPSIVLFYRPKSEGSLTATGQGRTSDPDHGLPGPLDGRITLPQGPSGGVQGRLDGRAVAQAEGLISLPDPPD